MAILTLPQNYHIVSATPTATTNATVTYTNISMKNVQMVWIVAYYLQAQSHATVLTPKLGSAVASCTTAITFTAPWWLNSDTSTNGTDALVAQTAASTFTLAAGATNQILVVQIDPAACLAQGATFDCLGATSATSSQATNFVTAFYICAARYPQATPPTLLTD